MVQIESTHDKFTEELQPLIQRQVSASAAELRAEAAQATALLEFKHASLSMELLGTSDEVALLKASMQESDMNERSQRMEAQLQEFISRFGEK